MHMPPRQRSRTINTFRNGRRLANSPAYEKCLAWAVVLQARTAANLNSAARTVVKAGDELNSLDIHMRSEFALALDGSNRRDPMKLAQILSLSLILCLVVAPAFSQSRSRYEVSSGYSFLGADFDRNRHGFVTSFTQRISGRFGIEAEVGGNYRKEPFLTQNDFVHSILAGPKFKFREDAKLVPWGHVLVGITIDDRTFPASFPNPSGGLSIFPVRTSDVNFALEPGGGIDYWLTQRFGVRIGADYRNLNFSNRDYFRLQSGVVLRFGGN